MTRLTSDIIDAVAKQHAAIVGKTGSGKTYTAKVFVEHLLGAQRRVCIIDPTGAWWGMKSSADGKKPGFPVIIFGGEHADVPITENSAAVLAETLAKENLPAIIDLSEFSKSATQRFITRFLEGLYRLNKKALHLVIDEADMFAPQRPMPDTKKMLHAVDIVVRRGRVKGLRVLMITQRPAVIHKDVLTQVNALIMMRLTSPQDRAAVKAWIEYQADTETGKAVLASLAKQAVGQGWLWAPDLDLLEQIPFPRIKTFDSSRTPDEDEGVPMPKVLAEVDLSRLKALLEPQPETSPKKRGVRTQPTTGGKASGATGISVADLKAAEQAAYEAGYSDGFQVAVSRATQETLKVTAARAAESVEVTVKMPNPPRYHRRRGSTPPAAGGRSNISPAPAPRGADATSLGPERRPLATLVRFHPIRMTEAQWANLTGMKRTGGTWSTYRSRLNAAGLIAFDGTHYTATARAVDLLGKDYPAPQSVDEVQAMWRKAVGPAAKLLDAMLQYPETSWPREGLAGAVDMAATGGSFNTYLSRLRSNNLIEEEEGLLALTDVLFTVPAEERAA